MGHWYSQFEKINILKRVSKFPQEKYIKID